MKFLSIFKNQFFYKLWTLSDQFIESNENFENYIVTVLVFNYSSHSFYFKYLLF